MNRTLTRSCGEARRLAFEPIHGPVTAIERWRAARHVERCGACRAFTADMRLLASRIPIAASGQGPSEEFVAQLRHAAAETAQRNRPMRRWWTGLAAGLVGLVALGSGLVSRGDADPLLAELVERQVALLTEPGIESANPVVVEQWIAGRTGLHVHVPTFDDARLLGAATTRVGGSPAAVVRFQVGSGYVTYTTVAIDGTAERDSTLRQAAVNALRLVWWRDTTSRHVWSGSVPAEHLTSLARRCLEQAAAAPVESLGPAITRALPRRPRSPTRGA